MDDRLQRDCFLDQIIEMATVDEDIYFLSSDMGAKSLDKFREDFPDRFIFCGIAEQNMINVAAGLASRGKKVYTFSMLCFYVRAYEQIRYSLAMMDLGITMLGVGPGFGYEDAGPAHYTVDDIGVMRNINGLQIWTPSDNTLTEAIAATCYMQFGSGALNYVRLERAQTPQIHEGCSSGDIFNGFKVILPGKSAIVTSGYTTHTMLQMLYENENLLPDVGLVDVFENTVPSLPLDEYKDIYVVEEQSNGTAVVLKDMGHKNVHDIGLPVNYVFENGGRDHLHKLCMIDSEFVLSYIRQHEQK
jgi:transketolase